jgi:hypothetical protein
MNVNELNYHLVSKNKKLAPITLDLFEAERYDSAVVVQQLIGNLVYYSNQGRYEPRIAESWQRLSNRKWIFNLKNNFECENGELINAAGFKKSLERSIYKLSQKGNLPVFSKLNGYNQFIKAKSNLAGIEQINNSIIFNFSEPVKSGLIEMLSYAPFGYICNDNLNTDGSWKDPLKFISSGPYRVKDISIGIRYVLEKRKEWPLNNQKSPMIVNINHTFDENDKLNTPAIIDSFTPVELISSRFSKYHLVPEYLNVILLGNLTNGFFAKTESRRLISTAIEKNRKVVPHQWENHIQSSSFYLSHQIDNPVFNDDTINLVAPKEALIIEGKEPSPDTSRWLAWKILKAALEELGWPYKFAENDPIWTAQVDLNYDIRIRGTSIGGGFEPWNININFCSQVGINLPDPTGEICKLLAKYEQDNINDEYLSKRFFELIQTDSVILPISHYGLQWYISSGINTQSISPLICIIRFDDLELE